MVYLRVAWWIITCRKDDDQFPMMLEPFKEYQRFLDSQTEEYGIILLANLNQDERYDRDDEFMQRRILIIASMGAPRRNFLSFRSAEARTVEPFHNEIWDIGDDHHLPVKDVVTVIWRRPAVSELPERALRYSFLRPSIFDGSMDTLLQGWRGSDEDTRRETRAAPDFRTGVTYRHYGGMGDLKVEAIGGALGGDSQLVRQGGAEPPPMDTFISLDQHMAVQRYSYTLAPLPPGRTMDDHNVWWARNVEFMPILPKDPSDTSEDTEA